MKKKFVSLITVVGVLLSLMLLQQTAMADYTLTAPTLGSGTAEDPYQIENAENLAWFAGLVNGTLTGTVRNQSANAVLTANIDLNPGYTFNSDGIDTKGNGTLNSWTPIGTSDGDAYKGTFDGANYTISGLYIGSYESYYCGLFGYSSGTIKNIKLDNSYISSSSGYVGGVCGYNDDGTITSCSSAGAVTGSYNVGGVCGYNYSGSTIENCSNSGAVTGSSGYVGGVCSENDATIENCYNTGTVTGSYKVGGVCGRNNDSGTITNCSNTGTVSGSSDYVGGVCGYNDSGTITNCSNTGAVSGSGDYVGGVCGDNYATIENCYNTGAVSGNYYVGGVCGYNYSGSTIENCSNTGAVSGTGNNVGGVCGENDATIENCYNTGVVTGTNRVGGVSGDNYATITNCYYLSGTATYGVGDTTSDTEGQTTVKTANQYASGEVCYLLNGDNQTSPAFGQLLSGTNADAYPVLYDGTNDVSRYTDDSGNYAYKNHSYTNGICTVCGGYAAPSMDADGVYQIENAGNLYWFAQLVNGTLTDTAQNQSANAVLTANIDLNPGYTFNPDGIDTAGSGTLNSWTPIGTSDGDAYKGTFDGADYTISGLYIGSYESYYCGLFGYSTGTIKNIKLDNSYIYSSEDYDCYVGGVCGYSSGTIENCSSAGTVSGDGNYVGGVCGYSYSGSITNCSNTGAVTGSNCYVGGVCGYSYSGSITNCSNSGTVSGTNYYVGGVCGFNEGTITSCSSAGTVSSSYDAGGVCGRNKGTITNCSNSGTVSGSFNVGGVCGYNNYGTIENCYNTGTVSSSYDAGGVCGFNEGTITNCSNIGGVTGSYYVGGVCGENSATIENCYNTGTVSASGYVGGVCGFSYSGSITTNCYYLTGTATTGVGYSDGGTESVTEKTATQYESGEVCYLLNEDTTAWYQNISTTENDKYPVLDSTHKQVYSNAGTYSNIEVTTQTSSKSEDADKGDYAYGYVTNINTNECTVNSLIWNVSAVNTDGKEAEGTVKYDGNTSDLRGNIKVGLILTKKSNSVYKIESVSAYVK